MSLIDPTNPAFWADGLKRSEDNGFCLGFSGEPVNWTIATAHAAAGPKISATRERQRQEGKTPGAFHGISRKADERQASARQKYSPAIEGREAGQRAGDRRAALRRGGI